MGMKNISMQDYNTILDWVGSIMTSIASRDAVQRSSTSKTSTPLDKSALRWWMRDEISKSDVKFWRFGRQAGVGHGDTEPLSPRRVQRKLVRVQRGTLVVVLVKIYPQTDWYYM
jgi:CxxC motif-containing protein